MLITFIKKRFKGREISHPKEMVSELLISKQTKFSVTNEKCIYCYVGFV